MQFRGKYWFLSNMYPSPICLGGVTYSCAEAAFQACKLADKTARRQFESLNGFQSKKLGRKIPLRADWEDIKINVMRWIVHEKFMQNEHLAEQLAVIGHDIDIVEENTWGDTFWGVCNGKGQNWLGKILNEEREFVQQMEEI